MSSRVSPIAVPPELPQPPAGWQWRRLTDLARLESGHTPSRHRPDWWDGDVSWISLTEVRALDGKWVESTRIRTNEAGIANSAARILPRGTVCFSRTASVGFVAIMAQPMATSQDFANWVCTDALDPEFLMYALICSRTELRELATGATHKTIYMPTLDAFHVRVPHGDGISSIARQRQIAARLKAQLAEVGIARLAAQAQVNEAKALRESVYREAFRAVVPVAVPPKFDDAPVDWRWRTLADIARLESGHTPSRQRPDWWGGDVSWVSLTEIRALDGQWVERTQLRTNEAGIAHSAARILPRGTVCFSRTASVGFVAIMAAPMATSQDFANWVCGDELEPEFLMHALIRSRKALRDLATGATHKTIYMPTLESFHVCAPRIDEQRRIVASLKSRLAEADAIAAAAAAQLAEIERLPQRLLAQAFEPSRVAS